MQAKLPLPGFHFRVRFEGLGSDDIDTRFQEVTGLTAEMTTEELNEGGENRFTHRLPVRAKYANLILKRGFFPDHSSSLIRWAEDAILSFDFKPCHVQVSLLNDKHEPVKVWLINSAYPVKLQVSDFKAQDNSLVIETFELAYKFFKRVQ